MRGKEYVSQVGKQKRRITPAYAGKSGSIYVNVTLAQDHPRVCGEKTCVIRRVRCGGGSPPRMRGKDPVLVVFSLFFRITPAYAGKRPRLPAGRKRSEDHPRVCGEKSNLRRTVSCRLGSPPRMRGKGRNVRRALPGVGITPAYAGKRLKRSRSTVPHAAIVPLFPSVCNKPAGSDGSPAGHDAPPFLPIENAVPASPAYNLRSL